MAARSRILVPALASLALLASLSVAPQATAANGNGTVTVVHGVPNLVVDVYVNGNLTLPSFTPGTVTEPLSLPAGDYDVVIVPAGGDPGSPAIQGSATLPAGASVSLVAHLRADGTPTLGVFVDDLSRTGLGRSRVVVRHAAAAPAVDAYLNRALGILLRGVTVRDLENGEQAAAQVLPGLFRARITPAGSSATVLGPASLLLKPNRFYAVYAVGSLAEGTLSLIVQSLPVRR